MSQEESASTSKINLEVHYDEAGRTESLSFSVKPTTKFSKIFAAFCAQTGKSLNMLKFTYDGKRVNGEDTPKMLEMEDGDSLDAHMEQIGGAAGEDEDAPAAKAEGKNSLNIEYQEGGQMKDLTFQVKPATSRKGLQRIRKNSRNERRHDPLPL